jgi:hypothetical protein
MTDNGVEKTKEKNMDGYVLVVHRDKVQTAVFPIDMGNQFADHPLELGRVS